MPTRIVDVIARDIRFPTSHALDGSDAMHPDPDYSAAYVVLVTDRSDGLSGHGLTFTCGRGTELCVAAAHSLAPLVRGKTLEEITGNMAAFWRSLTSDGQLRWVGPEKGVLHLATAAVVNAVWDLWAKVEGKPLWKLVVDMAPEDLVRCIDFRYITDVITPEEAVELLRRMAPGKAQREAELMAERLSGVHDLDGLAGLFRREDPGVCAGRRWPRGGGTSRSRWAATCRTTSAAAAWCARRSGQTIS